MELNLNPIFCCFPAIRKKLILNNSMNKISSIVNENIGSLIDIFLFKKNIITKYFNGKLLIIFRMSRIF